MSFLHNPRFQHAMRLLFWLALIFAVVMAELPKPPHTPIDRLGDKFAHMLAFATLAGLAALGFPAANRWRIAERLSRRCNATATLATGSLIRWQLSWS
jgi:hypothetical protein